MRILMLRHVDAIRDVIGRDEVTFFVFEVVFKGLALDLVCVQAGGRATRLVRVLDFGCLVDEESPSVLRLYEEAERKIC